MTTQFNSGEPIKLRGHHIANFVYLFINRRNRFSMFRDEPNHTEEDFYEKIKVYKLAQERKREVLEKLEDELYDLFLSHPDIKVEVVRGLDSLCAKCPTQRESCLHSKEDDFCLEAYGLTAGETYSAEDLMRRMMDYNNKNPLLETPRKGYMIKCLFLAVQQFTQPTKSREGVLK